MSLDLPYALAPLVDYGHIRLDFFVIIIGSTSDCFLFVNNDAFHFEITAKLQGFWKNISQEGTQKKKRKHIISAHNKITTIFSSHF